MADAHLSQAEADELMRMEKHRLDVDAVSFPAPGRNLTIALRSTDGREEFLLDVWRSAKNARRARFQLRARRSVILARIDLGGQPHHNEKDDTDIPAPHLHLYREGWGSGWARPVPSANFTNVDDHHWTLEEFMIYCNITEPPKFQWDLL